MCDWSGFNRWNRCDLSFLRHCITTRMSARVRLEKYPQESGLYCTTSFKILIWPFLTARTGSNNALWLDWSVIFQPFAGGQCTVTSKVGLQWVITSWLCVFVCSGRSSIVTRPPNVIAVSSHGSSRQQKRPATQGLASQSASFILPALESLM